MERDDTPQQPTETPTRAYRPRHFFNVPAPDPELMEHMRRGRLVMQRRVQTQSSDNSQLLGSSQKPQARQAEIEAARAFVPICNGVLSALTQKREDKEPKEQDRELAQFWVRVQKQEKERWRVHLEVSAQMNLTEQQAETLLQTYAGMLYTQMDVTRAALLHKWGYDTGFDPEALNEAKVIYKGFLPHLPQISRVLIWSSQDFHSDVCIYQTYEQRYILLLLAYEGATRHSARLSLFHWLLYYYRDHSFNRSLSCFVSSVGAKDILQNAVDGIAKRTAFEETGGNKLRADLKKGLDEDLFPQDVKTTEQAWQYLLPASLATARDRIKEEVQAGYWTVPKTDKVVPIGAPHAGLIRLRYWTEKDVRTYCTSTREETLLDAPINDDEQSRRHETLLDNLEAKSDTYEQLAQALSEWVTAAHLTPYEAQVLKLKILRQLPMLEIAAILSKSESAVKSALHRARGKIGTMRKELKKV
jgi:DNA-binding CsgD family transcriptional regulator